MVTVRVTVMVTVRVTVRVMKYLPDIRPYFFLHKNKEGFTVAIQKGLGVYDVLVIDDEGELLRVPTYGQDSVQFLYETIYKWLSFCPGDIPRKCIKLKESDNISLALEQLPLDDVSIIIPDLKKREFEEFKKTVKK